MPLKYSGDQLHQQILLAREEERKQVARELHDQIIQALVSLNYHVSDINRSCQAPVQQQLVAIQDDLRKLINDVRHICTTLRPSVLDSLGLIPAVRSYIRELERKNECSVKLLIDGDIERRLPEGVEICLYRVLQESLSNIFRHADAQQVVVTITIGGGGIALRVCDNGSGFVVPPQLDRLIAGQHFGLIGMRERLDIVGGRLEVESAPGLGTLISAYVAVPPQREETDEEEAREQCNQ